MSLTCGYTPKTTRCGAPATTHLLTRDDDDQEWVGIATCADHQAIALAKAHDFHPVGPGCHRPAPTWKFRPGGQSFCLDEDGDTAIHRAVREVARVLEATA